MGPIARQRRAAGRLARWYVSRTCAALCLLSAGVLAGGNTLAAELDWDSLGWPPGSLAETFTNVGGGDVTLTFTGETGALSSISGTPSPLLSTNYSGGLNPVEYSLAFRTNYDSGATDELTITIDFTHPGGVDGVSFGLFDVDRQSPENTDVIRATASDGSSTFDPTSVFVGAGNTFDGVNTVTGVSQCGPSSSSCNTTFVFTQSGITSVTIVTQNTEPTPDPGPQDIALHDLQIGLNPPVGISGRVFEDADFAGTASDWDGGFGDIALPAVDVELYTSVGTLVASTTTDASGNYAFAGVPMGSYRVRVRSATIGDVDTPPAGAFDACVPASCGYPLPEMTWADGAPLLGGQDPTIDDTTTPAGGGPGDTYVNVTLGGSDVADVNLGLAYNLIVNTGDDGGAAAVRSGQGTLRQFIKNANAIGGGQSSFFRISGAAPFSITALAVLPDINDADTALDASTQTGYAGTPIVELDGSLAGGTANGLSIRSARAVVRAFVINRFSQNGIVLYSGGEAVVEGNWIGVDTNGAAGAGNLLAGIRIETADNSIGGDTPGTANVFSGNSGHGIHIAVAGSDGNIIIGNLIGTDPTGALAIANGADGIRLSRSTGNRIGGSGVGEGNRVAHNIGAGIRLDSVNAKNNTISGNSFHDNTELGIDLQPGGVTVNDTGDTDSGPNDRLNFPVLESARIAGGNLTLLGWARPGSIIELFLSDGDAGGFGEGETYLLSLTEGSAADTDSSTGSYGPAPVNGLSQGQDTTNRFEFVVSTPPGVSIGANLTATATNGTNTSEFSGVVTATDLTVELSGTVYEDVDGDTVLADAIAAEGVRVRLYADVDGNGVVSTGDTFVDETITAVATGAYTFQVDTLLAGTTVLVAVDSKTVAPGAGFNVGFDQGDVWADQTYGDDPSTFALDLGARLGGRAAGVPDDFDPVSTTPLDNGYQHLARIDLTGGDVAGVDFAFSFNVVIHPTDGPDADLSADRTRQGSLRQFVQNANATSGPTSLALPPATYVLSIAGGGEDAALSGDLDITDDLNLFGGPSTTIIDANGIDRVFHLPAAATIGLTGLMIRGGSATSDGGGINVTGASPLTLAQVAVVQNSAGGMGGGINLSSGSATLTNVTISANSSSGAGGGIQSNGASVDLLNVTIAENTGPFGAGISAGGGQTGVRNAIVAGNNGFDCSQNMGTGPDDYNLDGDGSCGFGNTHDLPSTDPLLETLQNNGGPSWTHALQGISPAIDAGDDVACPAIDQRGVARPVDGDGDSTPSCDMGAVEYDGAAIPVVDLHTLKTVDNATPDENATITYTVTVTNNGPAQATNVSLDDVLPAGLTAGTVTPSQGSWTAPTWTIGTLANGTAATVTIQATVDAGTAGSVITNTVTAVTLDQVDSDGTPDTPSVDITVGNALDLHVLKTVDDATPDENATITYTVTVTNNGPAQATNVSLDDVLPAGLTAGTVTPSQGSWTAPTWTIGTLANGTAATVTIQATVDAGTAGSVITNTVTAVTLDQVDSDATPDTPSVDITVGNALNLHVLKTVDDATPDENATITYTVTVTNNGPAQATNVSLDDVLPAGLTAGLITPSQGSWTAPTWTVGTLNSSSSATLTIQATVNAGTAGSTITNTVTAVTLDQVDSDATPDTPSVDITVGNALDLHVLKTVDDATPDENATITYTVTVTNNGPAQATNVSLDDVLPAGLTAGTVTPSQGSWTAPTWTIGTLANGTAATVTFQATVDAGTAGSVITNTVTAVTLDQVDSDATPDTPSVDITVGNALDLHVLKTVDDATPDENQTITYTVTVTNNGPAQATNVSLDDVVPAGLTAGLITPSQGSWTAPTWTVGTLNSSSSATLTIQATVNAGTAGSVVTNTVTAVTLDQVDSDGTPDTPSVDITVGNALDLHVLKTVDDATPDENATITYTVTVTNNGPAQATNVSLDDVLPAGLTAGTVTPSQGSWTAPTWTVGTLANGTAATVTIQATVDAGTAGSVITNTVTAVTLDQVDSDATPDTPSVDITVGNALDLHVLKTVDDATPDEGQAITYTVTVTNNGPAQATNVSLDDVLPAGLTAGTVTPSQGSWTAPTWTVGTLANGTAATVTIQATVDASTAGSVITNTVTAVTLDQVDSDATPDTPSVDITVGNALDLHVLKTVDDATPDENATITYTVTVTNNGPAQATNVSLDDVLPAGLTAGTVTPSQGSWTAPTWTIGTLANGTAATVTIQATVDEGTAGSVITNTVTAVTLDQVDSDATPDTPSVDITVGNALNLHVLKTVDDATPDENATITYTVTVTNNGPAQATNVSLDDVLPAGLTAGLITPSQGSWTAPTWTVGTLNSSSSATLTIQATVNAGTAGSTITNTVTAVTLDQVDSDATPDTPSVDITVGNALDLHVLKTVDDATPDENATITYTVTVTNNGPAQATNVSLDDVLPAGLTAGTVTPSQGSWTAPTWTIGTLANGTAATVTFQATVDAGTAGSVITNTVTAVTLDQVDSDATPDTPSVDITVGNALDLHVLKTVDDATPDENQTITYTVTVTNNGPAQATNVSLDDVLPAGLTAGTVTPSQGSWTAPTWTVGTLANGTAATVTIQATVDAGTAGSVITNTVTAVTLDQVDSDATPDTPSVDITVGNALDLHVLKTVDDATPDENATITYTVTVTNNGPAQATNVSLDDVLPAGLTAGTVTPSQGSWTAPTWTIGTLANGTAATVTIQATVDAGTAGSVITNTVTAVTLDQVDSDPTPDIPSVDITVGNALDLHVLKTVDDATPDENQTITYTVTVTNNGPAQATNVSLDDVVPAGLTAGLITPSQGSWTAPTWTIGTLNSSSSATLTIQATVNAGTAGTTITNTVTAVSLDQTDSDATVDTLSAPVTVNSDLDLLVVKSVDDATPDEGQAITYTVTVTNNGPAQATNVTLDDVVPAGITAGLATPGQGSWTAPTWAVGTLNSSSSATLTIQATVDAGTAGSTITNTVTAVGLDQTDSDATADTLSVPLTVNSDLDLLVAKSVDDATPDENATITYTVTVTNNGPAQATNVSLDDVLPAGLTAGTVTPSQGSWTAPTWTVGTLNIGSAATLTTLATVDAGTAGSVITNTVTAVALDQVDSDATPDTPSADITVGNALDLHVEKTVDDATPDENATITYTVTVTNNGPAQATNVTLDDVLPAGLTVGTVTPSQGSWTAPTWTIGTLANGTAATVTIQATVDAGTAGSVITNTVTAVTLDQVDSDATPDTPSVDITVGLLSDLSLAQSIDNPTPSIGVTIQLTLSVTNAGPSPATGVQVRDVLPPGLQYLGDDGGGAYDEPTGTWTVGSLAATSTRQLGISARVVDDNTPGAYDNFSEVVVANEPDPDSTPDNGPQNPAEDDEALLTVAPVGSDAAITITATSLPGDTLTITVNDADRNVDPGTVESLPVVVVNNATGESEQLVLAETGPSTGTFSTTLGTVYGAGAGTSDDGVCNTKAGDTLTASYLDQFTTTGSAVTRTDSGLVAGGAGGELEITPRSEPGDTITVRLADADLDTDPGSSQTIPLTVTNDMTGETESVTLAEIGTAGGVFSGTFGTVAGSSAGVDDDGVMNTNAGHTLTVVYDDSMSASGGSATVTATGLVSVDGVRLVKTALKDEVVVGDIVAYDLTVVNTTDVLLRDVIVVDRIPVGFDLVRDSARRISLGSDGRLGTSDDESNRLEASGSRPVELGPFDLNPGETVVLRYVLEVGSGAVRGNNVNTATPLQGDVVVGNTASATVAVVLDPILDATRIIGKVFEDLDRDGRQDAGEPGIANALVALDNGTYSLTDEYGRYHIPAIAPGQRMVKLDLRSLPPGTELSTRVSRILWLTPGLTGRANFGVVLRTQRETIGRPEELGVAVSGETDLHPLEIQGRVEAQSFLVNGTPVALASADVRLEVETLDDSVHLTEAGSLQPIAFGVRADPREGIEHWRLRIADGAGGTVRELDGSGAPPAAIPWDGRTQDGALVESGEIYQYQFAVRYVDGRAAASPRGLFGVNRDSVLSLELTGNAFEVGEARLSPAARQALEKAGEALTRYPDEKIVIEGHTDSEGSAGYNLALSRKRAEAASSYLVDEFGFASERIVLNWFGEDQPIASNEIPEGRGINRRVELKAEILQPDNSRVTERYHGAAEARINGEPLVVQNDGRFLAERPGDDPGVLEVELTSSQGRHSAARIAPPALDILTPRGRSIVPYGGSAAGCSAESAGPRVICRLTGRTDAGGVALLDGEEIEIAPDGAFGADLHLGPGRNEVGIVVRSPDGFTRSANLTIQVTDRDAEGEVLVVTEGVPNLMVDLPPAGSRLTRSTLALSGRTDPGNLVWANDTALEVHPDGRFDGTVELPTGPSRLVVRVEDPEGRSGEISQAVEVAKNQLFLLAFADGVVGRMSGSGQLEGSDLEEDEYYTEGRVAFYLKGMIAGKYLIASSFDSRREELEELFSDLNGSATDRLLTNLDPDRIYPVYGDDSSVVFDAQSRGKFYLALDSDTIHAVVGNYPLALTDTELAAYVRTFYGARFLYQSASKTRFGKPNTEVVLFAADVQQIHVTDALRATGGSLYYLSHVGVIMGSEEITLTVRDKRTGVVLRRQRQRQNVDYTIKYPEGRVMFHRPIRSVEQDAYPIDLAILSGNPVFIEADYEARVEDFEEAATGGRVRQQIGDRVALGVTRIDDQVQSGSYELSGVDGEVRLGQHTRLLAEYAESQGNASRSFVSNDGGLTYTAATPTGDEEGTAWKAAAELDIGEWFGSPERYQVKVYFKDLAPGFFSNGNLLEQGTRKIGASGLFRITEKDSLVVSRDEVDRSSSLLTEGSTESTITSAQWNRRGERWNLSVEYQANEVEDESGESLVDTELLAARYRHRITKKLTGGLEHQETLSGRANDQTTLGVEYQALKSVALQLQATEGDLGRSALGGAVLTLGESEIYVTKRLSDNPAGETTSTIVGARSPLGAASRVYSEYQWERADAGDRSISLFGIQRQWDPSPGFRFLLGGESANVEADSGNRDRTALTGSMTYSNGERLTALTRTELRFDRGERDEDQWVTFNKVDYKLGAGLTLLGKYSYSKTEDRDTDEVEARLEVSSIGLAYRPVHNDRFNALFRYTRLVDLRPVPAGPIEQLDRTSDVLALDTVLEINRRLEWVAKVAAKVQSERPPGLDEVTTRTYLTIQRFNVVVWKPIRLGAEFRDLRQRTSDDVRQGWLGEVTWDVIEHFRLGAGYNFTDFSDNEFSSNDYDVHGWFLRVQGRY